MITYDYKYQFKYGETDLALESAEHICKLLKKFSNVKFIVTRKNGTVVSIIKNEFFIHFARGAAYPAPVHHDLINKNRR